MDAVIEKLLGSWNIGGVVEICTTQDGVMSVTATDGLVYVFKERGGVELAEQLEREFRLLSALHERGIPIAVPLSTSSGACFEVEDSKCYCLYPRIEACLPDGCYTPGAKQRLLSVGRELAKLHGALRECDELDVFPEENLVRQVRSYATPLILEHSDNLGAGGAESLIDFLNATLPAVTAHLPRQLIHRDPHLGNILFTSDDQVAGFVDFDLAVRGLRVFDLCYCSTGMLSEADDCDALASQWGELVIALIDGYEGIGDLCSAEKKAIWHVMLAIQCLFIAYFCEQDPNVKQARKNSRILMWLHENRDFVNNAVLGIRDK